MHIWIHYNPQSHHDAEKGDEDGNTGSGTFVFDALPENAADPRTLPEAAADNSYTPDRPRMATASDSPRSHRSEGYAMLYVKSSGADPARPVQLGQKKSTGQRPLWEIRPLSDVRKPASSDPRA